MYLHEDGIKDQIKKERISLMLMTALLAFTGLVIWGTLTYSGFNTGYLVCYILLFALSVKLSRVYLFLTPRRKYGTVREIKDYKTTYIRSHGGASGTGATYSGGDFTEVTIVLDFDKGARGEYVFIYRGDLKVLKAGDRIGIFRFLKMPVWAEK